MELETVLDRLKQCTAPETHIPAGKKENVYVVIDDERNVNRRKKGLRSEYSDNCGVWDSASGASSKFTYVAHPEGLTKVYLCNNTYCTQRMVQKKMTYVPLEQQPDPDSLLEVRRVYSK